MATTFGLMQADIASDLSRSTLTTQIKKAINRAVTFYQREPWWFNEGQATTPTVAGQELYALPTDFRTPQRLTLYDPAAGTTDVLAPKPNEWLDQNYPTVVQARPSSWSILTNELRLKNIPDAVYTLTLTYWKSYVALSADADTNDMINEAEDLIRFRAEWDVWANTIRNTNNATVALAQAKEQFGLVRRQSAKIKRTGLIQPAADMPIRQTHWNIFSG